VAFETNCRIDPVPFVAILTNMAASGSGIPLGSRPDAAAENFSVSHYSSRSPSAIGLPGRDCRTTKMRERDARAAIAANAAHIRLCVKTDVARLAQSPGTSGRIFTAVKAKTRDTSDT